VPARLADIESVAQGSIDARAAGLNQERYNEHALQQHQQAADNHLRSVQPPGPRVPAIAVQRQHRHPIVLRHCRQLASDSTIACSLSEQLAQLKFNTLKPNSLFRL
jgi:hypothetical protein